MITLNKKDGFAASGEIGFEETAMTFFCAPRHCESEEHAKEQ